MLFETCNPGYSVLPALRSRFMSAGDSRTFTCAERFIGFVGGRMNLGEGCKVYHEVRREVYYLYL